MRTINYTSSQPHADTRLVEALLDRLDVPRDWIAVTNTGGGTLALMIALAVDADDTGDGESGPAPSWWPTRYALLTCDGPHDWILGFYLDEDNNGGDEGECVALMPEPGSGEPTVEQVADSVARVLTRATALKPRPLPLVDSARAQDRNIEGRR